MTVPLSDAEAYALFGPNRPVPPPPSPQNPIDEQYAYNTYAPAGGTAKTSTGPLGGVINYTIRDPNGYAWVDNGTPSGYWYRPEDGAVWQPTPETRGQDAIIAAKNLTAPLIGAKQTPVTNAPVVATTKSKDAAITAALKGKVPGPTPVGKTDTPYTLSGPGVTLITNDPTAPGSQPDAPAPYFRFTDPPPPSQLDLKPRGFIADLTTPLLPTAVTERTTDLLPEPLERAAEFSLSPAGLASAALSGGLTAAAGGSFLKGAGADLAANLAGEAAQYGAEKAGAPAYVSIPLGIAGGIGGEALAARSLLRSAPGSPAPAARQAPDSVAPAPAPLRPPTPSEELNTAVRVALGEEVADVPPVRATRDAPPPAVPQPSPKPVAVVAPDTRTVPTPAAVASTKKPTGVVETVVTAKRGRTILEERIVYNGENAGVIRRSADGDLKKWTGEYRNPDGALVAVPRNAAGEHFTGTKGQVTRAVANAYESQGKILQDVPRQQRAPRVAAAVDESIAVSADRAVVGQTGDDMEALLLESLRRQGIDPAARATAAPLPVRAGKWMVHFEDDLDRQLYLAGAPGRTPEHSAEVVRRLKALQERFPGESIADIHKRVNAVRQAVKDAPKVEGEFAGMSHNFDVKRIPSTQRSARQADELGATGTGPRPRPVPDYEKGREAARVAKSPVKAGQSVFHNGTVYEVRGISTETRHVTLNNVDGSIARGPKGTPLSVPWDQVDVVIVPPHAMSVRSMVRELDDHLPAELRSRIYAQEAAWEARLKAGKEITPEQQAQLTAMREALEPQVQRVRDLGADRALRAELDTPAARQAADEVAARLPKDVAEPGSAANQRARDAQLGAASAADEALHEAEVRAAHKLMAQDAPPIPPGTANSIIDAEMPKPRSRGGRVAGNVGTAAMIPFHGLRNLLLAGDLLLGRQLRGTLLTYPKEALSQGYTTQIRALFSPAFRKRMWAAVDEYAESHPHLPLLRHGDRASMSEELFIGKLWHNLPILGQIEQANALALNATRIALDKKLTAMVGRELTDEALASQGHFIGVLTGRGGGEFLDNYARVLNSSLFISSRWTASRFQFWGLLLPNFVGRSRFGQRFGMGTTEAYLRREAQKRILTATAVAAGMYALMEHVAGVTTVTDWRSSKFGQFQINGRWYDFMGGLEEPARLMARIAHGEGVSERGSKFPVARLNAVGDYVTGRMPPLSRLIAEQMGYLDPWQERPGPLSKSFDIPGTNMEIELKRYIPLAVQQMSEMWQDINDGRRGVFGAVIDAALIFGGEGVNEPTPIAAWETALFADKKMRAALDRPEFKINADAPLSRDNLNRAGWEFVRNNPDIFGEKPPQMMREFRETAERVEKMRAGRRSDQEANDAKLEAGNMTVRDWRIDRSAARRQLARDIEAQYGEFPPSDPNSADVIERYFAAIDANKHADTDGGGEVIDWDAVEEWEAQLSTEDRAKLNAYFDEKARQGTEREQAYYQAMNLIEESGYWDKREEYFQVWKRGRPEAEGFATYADWRKDAIDRRTEEIMAEDMVPRWVAAEMAIKEGAGDFSKDFKADVLYGFVEENPEAAKALRDWGYYTPDGPAKDILAGRGSEEAQAVQSAAQVKRDLEAIPEWQGWESRAWQDWARANMPAGASAATITEYRESETAARIAAEERRRGRKLTAPEQGEIKAQVSAETEAYTSTTVANAAASVTYVNDAGKSTTGRISHAGLAQVEAIKAAYDRNPAAVRAARANGVAGFRDSDLSAAEKAWLEQHGVVLD